MIMSPQVRKLALTLHVTASIGWFGAVAAFLVLAVAGLAGQSPQLTRAAYLAMAPITWVAILPMAVISLLSGVVSSMGTRWGLVRYYWVLVKLFVTAFAALVLVIHIQPIDHLARAASSGTAWDANLHGMQLMMAFAAAAAVAALAGLTVLSIYKPPGMTPYGARKLLSPLGARSEPRT